MKKHISIMLVVCLLIQSCLPVFAQESMRTLPMQPPIRDIVIPPIILPTPTPTRTPTITPTPTIPAINQDNPIILPKNKQTDSLPSTEVIKPPEPYPARVKGSQVSTADIDLVIDEKLFTLSLSAAKYPGKPAQANNGYPTNNVAFIDWNRTDRSWWFKWTQKMNVASKVVWQVSNMPYTGSTKDMEEPLGLVANGIVDSGQREFNIDFNKFTLSRNKIQKNFITQDYVNLVNNAVSAQSSSASSAASNRRFVDMKSSLAKQAGNVQTARINNIKKVFEQKSIKGIGSLSGTITKITSLGGTRTKLVPEATMAARKEILESMGFSNTLYKYYVRVITLDKNGKPFGNPSNPIEVIYGDPSYDEAVTNENQSVLVTEPSGNFGHGSLLFLGWSDSKNMLTRSFVAPLSDTENYAYSYFQVTSAYPEVSRLFAFRPAGLVETVFSENLGKDSYVQSRVTASIDFIG